MSNNNGSKQKDFALFEYNPNDERAVKISFSGNVTLDNGNKGTILGVKGQSKDGTKRFLRVFAQVGTLWKNDENFSGSMNYPEAGGEKSLIAWLNKEGTILSGYKNDPKKDNKKQESKQQSAPF